MTPKIPKYLSFIMTSFLYSQDEYDYFIFQLLFPYQNHIERKRECLNRPFSEIDFVAYAVFLTEASGRIYFDVAHIPVRFVIMLEIPCLKGFYQRTSDRRIFGIKRMSDQISLSAESVHSLTAQGNIRIVRDLSGLPRQLMGHDIKALSVKVGINISRGRYSVPCC